MTLKTRRWLARASFALMLAAVAILLGFAGWHSLTLIAFAAGGACAVAAGGVLVPGQPGHRAVAGTRPGNRRPSMLHTMRDNHAGGGAAARVGGQVLVVLGAIAVTFVAGLLFCRLRLRSRNAGTTSAPDHASDERASAQLSEPGADSIPPRWGVGAGAGH